MCETRQDVRIPEDGVPSTYEQPNMGAGNRIQVLFENITSSFLGSQLTSPTILSLSFSIFRWENDRRHYLNAQD